MEGAMRRMILLSLALLSSGCLAPGERNPTRYPWGQPRHAPVVARGAIPPLAVPPTRFVPPQGTFCVVALEPQSKSGINVTGKAPGIMACSTPIAPSSAWKQPR
jgi:hypothetical protein